MKLRRLVGWGIGWIVFLTIGFGISTSMADPPVGSNGTSNPPAYVPGEILVKWTSSAKTESTASILVQMGGSRIKSFQTIGVDHVKLSAGKSVEAAISELQNDPQVAYAEPNYYRTLKAMPNDEFFACCQWGLNNTGQTIAGVKGAVDADIDAPEAWDITTGSKGVVVAVIDTGINWNETDLYENLWFNPGEGTSNDGIDNDGNGYIDDFIGWNFVDHNSSPWDDHHHGSHVSGIIGASGNNGHGVSGVCWRVSIMALKAFDAQGNGTTSDIVSALIYAHQMGARVINLSFGDYSYSQSEKDAIDLNSQAVVVCAAGNEGSDNDGTPHYPSGYPSFNIISVAASDQFDNLAVFDQGKTNFGASTVDLAAPGDYILSTWSTSGEFWYLSGTSMAAPMVSGTAALMLSVASLSPSQIISTILSNVDPKPNYAGLMTSSGRLNAYKSLRAVAPGGKDDDDGGGGGCFITTTLAGQ